MENKYINNLHISEEKIDDLTKKIEKVKIKYGASIGILISTSISAMGTGILGDFQNSCEEIFPIFITEAAVAVISAGFALKYKSDNTLLQKEKIKEKK